MGLTFRLRFWQETDPNTYLSHHVVNKVDFREIVPTFMRASVESMCVFLQKGC
jgi:hypothetical protein